MPDYPPPPFRNIAAILEYLLQFCRSHQEIFHRTWMESEDERRLGRDACARLFSNIAEGYFNENEAEQTTIELNNLCSQSAQLVQAYYGFAQELDASRHFQIMEILRDNCGCGEFVANEDVLIPTPRTSLDQYTDSRLNTRPASRGPLADAVPHFRLAPADMRGVRVTYDFRIHLSHLCGVSLRRFASATVNYSNEMSSQEIHTRDGCELVFKHGPHAVAGADQLHRLNEVLKFAQDKADVLIFPELSMSSGDDQRRILDEFHKLGSSVRLKLVVAGSVHEAIGDMNCNIARFAFRNPTDSESIVFEHKKFNPFIETRETRQKIREDITPESKSLRVIVGEGFTLCVLVCKDFIDPGCGNVLEALAVTHVVVPALSKTTGIFGDFGQSLATANQTQTYVANSPARSQKKEEIDPDHDGVVAIRCVPLRQTQVTSVGFPVGASVPAVCVFPENWGKPEWISVNIN